MERAMKMALVHDICEVYSPDFTAYDAVAINQKKKLILKMNQNHIDAFYVKLDM